MGEHSCIQEKTLERLERAVDKLYKIIEGNGSDGLNTRVALLIQAVDNLPSPAKLKAHAFFGGGIVAFISFLGVIVWKILQ